METDSDIKNLLLAKEALKTRQFHKAQQIFNVIIEFNPNHAEANHGLGVALLESSSPKNSLPYFKSALIVNPTATKYWTAYIDNLIRLERLVDAKKVLNQYRSKGGKGEVFKRLERRIKMLAKEPSPEATQSATHSYELGNYEQALLLAEILFEKFPNSVTVNNLLGAINGALERFENASDHYNNALAINPKHAPSHLNLGVLLKSQGELDHALKKYNDAIKQDPKFAKAYYNKGNIYRDRGELNEALVNYRMAYKHNSNFAGASFNIACILHEMGDTKASIKNYKRAVKVSPNYVDALVNLANAYLEQSNLDASEDCLRRAQKIAPNRPDAENLLGNVYLSRGEVNAAHESFKKASEMDPAHLLSLLNRQTLKTQLFECPGPHQNSNTTPEKKFKESALKSCRYLVTEAIRVFLIGELGLSMKIITEYRELSNSNQDTDLLPTDAVFCDVYANFLTAISDRKPPDFKKNKIYHIGESHCLSYAHCNLNLNGQAFTISPRICFGAKAYHFSQETQNSYKQITAINLNSLPRYSNVFISFGEIDCRFDEGFIPAARKLKIDLETLIKKTTEAYVEWFLSINTKNKHDLYFFNIPAPVYNLNIDEEQNNNACECVRLFNKALEVKVMTESSRLINVYSYTQDARGYSNTLFHCDTHHLDSRILKHIETQTN